MLPSLIFSMILWGCSFSTRHPTLCKNQYKDDDYDSRNYYNYNKDIDINNNNDNENEYIYNNNLQQ